MGDWIKIGDSILSVDNIEFIERIGPAHIKAHMSSGKIVELKQNIALELWKYLDGERLKFLDLDNPERNFSGT
jgi:hypothetical protein